MNTMEEFFQAYPFVQMLLAVVAVAVAALLANFVMRAILLRILNRMLQHTPYGRDEELRGHGVVERLTHAIPALVVSYGVALVPHLPVGVVTVVQNVANSFIMLTLAMALAASLNVIETIYHRRPEARRKPIKGYVQVVKIALYVVAAIFIIATLIDRSPLILISGLGAMAAVLILVFQDTLLSLVAGIQISSTDMVRVGDWIEMPGQNADGDVIEIALHTVRVQNWDKTITTVPIRKLVTEPFKNWRAMHEAGGRRIKRSIYLDQASIRFLTAEEIERLSHFRHLEEYLQRKKDEISRWNASLGESGKIGANTRRITNIGTFRAYVQGYLRDHPQVHNGMTMLVRQLQPGPEGLPLEIYCFTNTTVWAAYEGIQADIFDHLLALMPEFGLSVFQSPSGADFARMGSGLLPANADMRRPE